MSIAKLLVPSVGDLSRLAGMLQEKGEGLAAINPQEARMLKRAGGSGKPLPGTRGLGVGGGPIRSYDKEVDPGSYSKQGDNKNQNRGGLESSKNDNMNQNRGGLESYKEKKRKEKEKEKEKDDTPPPPPPPPDDDDDEKEKEKERIRIAKEKEKKRLKAIEARNTALQELIDAINADYSDKYGVTSPGAADSGDPGSAPKGGYYNDLVEAYIAEHNPELLEAYEGKHQDIYADIRGQGVYDPTYYNTQKSALDTEMEGQEDWLQELAEAWAQGHLDDDLAPILKQVLEDANALVTGDDASIEDAQTQTQAIKDFDYSTIYDSITTPVPDGDEVPEFFDQVYTPKTSSTGTGSTSSRSSRGGATPGPGVTPPTMYYGGGPPTEGRNPNKVANSMFIAPVGPGSSKVIRG